MFEIGDCIQNGDFDGVVIAIVDGCPIVCDEARNHVLIEDVSEWKLINEKEVSLPDDVVSEYIEENREPTVDPFIERCSHYKGMAVQPLQVMLDVLEPKEMIGFLKGSAIKYSMRAGHKEGESVYKEVNKYNDYARWIKEYEKTGTLVL